MSALSSHSHTPPGEIFWSGTMGEIRERNGAREKFRALRPQRIVSFEHAGYTIRFFVPHAMRDKMQIVPLLRPGFLEPGLLELSRRFVRPGATVLDVGANFGNHTVWFSRVLGAARVHAFEPQAAVFAVLERNIAINGLEGVRAHRLAVGEAPTRARLARVRGDNSGTASFAVDPEGEVPVARIDDMADAFGAPVDFMKIDVEGMQMPVLHGARGLIGRDRPALWIELRDSRGEADEPLAWLSALGYRAFQAGPRDWFFEAPRNG